MSNACFWGCLAWLYLLNSLFYCLWFVYFCLYFYSYGDQFLKPKQSTLSKPYCPFIWFYFHAPNPREFRMKLRHNFSNQKQQTHSSLWKQLLSCSLNKKSQDFAKIFCVLYESRNSDVSKNHRCHALYSRFDFESKQMVIWSLRKYPPSWLE